MKLMKRDRVEAVRACGEILVENAQPVESDSPCSSWSPAAAAC